MGCFQLLFDGVSKLNTDVCPILDLDKAIKVVLFKVFIDNIAIGEVFKVFNKLYWLPFDSTTFLDIFILILQWILH